MSSEGADALIRQDYSFAAEVIRAYLAMGGCPHGYDRQDLAAFVEHLGQRAAVLDRPAPPPQMSAWKLHLVGDRQQLAGAIRASTGSLNFRADHSAIGIFADAVVTAYQRQIESRPAPPPEEHALDWPESEEFFNLMQAYRHAPQHLPGEVVASYEAVKAFLRAASRPAPEPDRPKETT